MRTHRILFVSFVSFLIAQSGFCYVPPSQYIIKVLTKKHDGVKALRIKSDIVALDANRPTEVHFKEVLVFNVARRILQSTAMDDSGRVLYRVERMANGLTLPDTLLLEANLKNVIETLRDNGLPIRTEGELLALKDEEERRKSEIESLTRWKGTPAWVIGEQKKEVPQLWIEKDTFLPIRILYTPKGVSSLSDLRFESFRFHREFPYPRAITLIQKGDIAVLQANLLELQVNPDISEIEMGRDKDLNGFTDIGNSVPSSLRELVRQYYEIIR